jgi:hypothetical protein
MRHLRCRLNYAYFHFYKRLISTKSASLRMILNLVNTNLFDIPEKFGMTQVYPFLAATASANQRKCCKNVSIFFSKAASFKDPSSSNLF